MILAALLLSVLTGDVERIVGTFGASVEVGEPAEIIIAVTHPRDRSGSDLTAGELVLDDSWVLLDSRLEPGTADEDDRVTTRRIWRVASLEPGTRELTIEGLAALDDGGPSMVQVTVEVAGLLGPDEDAPRPLRRLPASFGDSEPAAGLSRGWLLFLLGAGAVFLLVPTVLALGGWLVFRRAGRIGFTDPVDPLTRWERLRAMDAVDARSVRRRHYELSRLLREAVDRARWCNAAGLTDDEWLEAVAHDPRIDPDLHAPLGEVLAACARVKYAGDLPSSFATDEVFADARRVLEVLAAPRGVEVPS